MFRHYEDLRPMPKSLPGERLQPSIAKFCFFDPTNVSNSSSWAIAGISSLYAPTNSRFFVRLYRQYRSPIRQIVIFLKPTTSPLVHIDSWSLANTQHCYRVVRLWEESAQALLAFPTLWPLAILADATEPEAILRQVAQGLNRLTNRAERANLAAYIYLLGGLRFREGLLRQLLREEIMQESVTYQALLEKGKQQGRLEGRHAGEQALTLRQLHKKLGPLPENLVNQIQSLSLEQLEQLAEALLEFESLTDLVRWLS